MIAYWSGMVIKQFSILFFQYQLTEVLAAYHFFLQKCPQQIWGNTLLLQYINSHQVKISTLIGLSYGWNYPFLWHKFVNRFQSSTFMLLRCPCRKMSVYFMSHFGLPILTTLITSSFFNSFWSFSHISHLRFFFY